MVLDRSRLLFLKNTTYNWNQSVPEKKKLDAEGYARDILLRQLCSIFKKIQSFFEL